MLIKFYLINFSYLYVTFIITIKSTFLELQHWLDIILEGHPNTNLILVGNKLDLSNSI